jgi:hypothetical protein
MLATRKKRPKHRVGACRITKNQPDDLGIFRSSEDALALTEDRIGDRGRLVETIDDPAPGIMEARESFGPVLIPGDRIATPALSL